MTDSERFQSERDRSGKGSEGIQAQPTARFHQDSARFQVPYLAHRTSERKGRPWLLLSVVLLGMIAIDGLILSCTTEYQWVGSATVESQLLVVDADTAEPIPHAKVLFVKDEQWDAPEELITDSDGLATVAKRCTSAGRSGGWRRDTRSVSVEPWSFMVEAKGYQTSDPRWASEYRSQTQDQGSTFVLPIRLELKKTDD